ncbi:MAG TPA: glycosyltransferase family 4 protein [Methylomirabilota bacterium]|jgi:glycosyltransferase involved in cell wall biosynthesis|nr:glycosyltransferase family 4 protein [Methylomirabilota bacterium]
MSQPVDVLFLHASDEAYGADRVLLSLVLALRDRGQRVAVILADDLPPGWLSSQLAAEGIAFERGPLAPARRRYLRLAGLPAYLRALIAARRHLRRRVRALHAQIVHVNTTALLVAAILGRPGGCRMAWHVHEIVVRPRPIAWLLRLAPVLTADRVICVSDAVRRHLTQWGLRAGRIVTVRNGIPPREPAPLAALSGDGPLVAYIGRLNRWKGYDLFVRALAQVAPAFPAARFVVAGDPPPGEEWRTRDLQERLAAAGLTDRVLTPGFIADGAAVCDAADVVAVPSTWPDPFPTVVLEAMRAGCAVVAASGGGVPEMVENGVSGVLVPPGDTGALADAISALLAEPRRMERLGEAARARVAAEFSVERMVEGVVAVYRDLGR